MLPDQKIAEAAALLRAGRLVAFPTETVYGLGANTLDPEAVSRIYKVKGRPATSPLIVHVNSIGVAQSLVRNWPDQADLLARKFWPGPLTLVLEKHPSIPDIVTAGLNSVGLRIPNHPVAQALIQAARLPLAAPSANRFTQLSPTTADHVRQGLGSDVDMILDGGPCEVGIESAVISLVGSQPVLLRPGGISRAQIESTIGPIAAATDTPAGTHPAPGMHPRHYSPRTRLLLVENGDVPQQGNGIYLQLNHAPSRNDTEIIQMPALAADYAAALYNKLHQADAAACDWIAVDLPPQTNEWQAVLDRLQRAASWEGLTSAI